MLQNLPGRFNSDYVFCNEDGSKIGEFRKFWITALEIARIEDFRVHDLKHCAVTNLLLAGVPPTFIEHMADHNSDIMRRRYTTLIEEHVLSAVKLPEIDWNQPEESRNIKG